MGKLAAYITFVLVSSALAATLYRVGPSREQAKWRWITPGSLFTGITWILLTLGFNYYATSVANYSVTYGPLGTMVALLSWMYLSAYVLIIGAELNSEIEFQTVKDSTTGQPRPMGQRGAWAADHSAADVAPEEQVKIKGEGPSLGAAGPPMPDEDKSSSSVK